MHTPHYTLFAVARGDTRLTNKKRKGFKELNEKEEKK